jgi:hypothetical protein
VSRTFGDLEAKISSLGGNPSVVVAIPEIRSFRIEDGSDCDFIVLGSKDCSLIFLKVMAFSISFQMRKLLNAYGCQYVM